MQTYRIVWPVLAGLLAALGGCLAFVAWPVPVVLAIFVFVAAPAFVLTKICAHNDDLRLPAGFSTHAGTNAAVGGAGMVALAGLGTWLAEWVVPLGLLVLASSPAAISWAGRRLRPTRPTPQTGPPPEGPTYSCADEAISEPLATLPTQCSTLDDAELCLAWRSSYTHLQRARSVAEQRRIVEARQRYLDEFERRNRPGLAAWLAAGARAAGDPSKYLAHGS